MQTSNRILDDLARVANGAVSTLVGIKNEIDALVRQRIERLLNDADVVPREEFDAVKAMAAKARAEQEALAQKVARLEAALKAAKGGRRKRAPARTSAKTSARGRASPRKSASRTTARKATAP